MVKRAPVSQPTSIPVYYEAIRKTFQTQWDNMTSTLPHEGERGRNDEERLKKLLRQVLPTRFQIGTGFVINSKGDTSRQTDIIIYDEHWNAPVFRELVADIVPVECVYATIEVKATLNHAELKKSVEAMGIMRKLAKAGKHYMDFKPMQVTIPGSGTVSLAGKQSIPSDLAPRSYLFAYSADVTKPATLAARMKRCSAKNPGALVHGVYVLRENWFHRLSNTPSGQDYRLAPDNGLLRFCVDLIESLQSFPMAKGDPSVYIK